ncbi:MAG: tetratricopeptide repeat protein [Lachnospiraceae bacterium]|nr:tetratricopeptide repeat protein [Lachnospiraceae bacterium]
MIKKRIRIAVPLLAGVLLLSGCARSDAKEAYSKGCAALEEAQTESARQYFNGVIESGYYLTHAYRGLGIAYMKEGNYADACIAFEKGILEFVDEPEDVQKDLYLYLAACRELQGQQDKAMEIYDSLIRKNPDTEVLFLRAKLQLRNGNVKEAQADFDQAVAQSNDYDLFINIYEIFRDADRSGDGASYLEHALDIASSREDDYYEKGLVSYYLQNYEEAKEHLISAIRADETDSRAIFLLGKVYLAMNDTANARAVYQSYTANEAMAAGSYNGLALCDIAEKNYDSAMQNVEKGLSYDSSSQGLLYNEIVLYEQMRDWTKAKARAAAYVAKFPTDEAGLREYEFLSTR